MDVRLLPIRGLKGETQERWQVLVGEALEPNPTFEPEALVSATVHHRAWADTKLLAVRDRDRFVACVPVQMVQRWRHLPVRALTTRPNDGPVPLLPVLGTPLVAADAAAPALRTLLSALASGQVHLNQLSDVPGRLPSVLVLERWNDEGPVACLWRAACRTLGLPLHIIDTWQRPVVRRVVDEGADWPTSLDRRRLVKVERRRRHLSDEVGPVRCVDRWDDPAAVEEFISLEASGWKGRAGTALRDQPQQSAAFRDICARWAADRRLVMLTLEAGGRPLAMRCAVRSGAGLFQYRSAYDEAYARHGPGVLIELAVGEYWLARTDLKWIDPCCAPTNTFFPDLFPDRLPVATAVTGLGTIGRGALATLNVARPAAKRIGRQARHLLGHRIDVPVPTPSGRDPGGRL